MRGRKPKIGPAADALTKVPPAPDWLIGEARVEWRRAAKDMVARRTLTASSLSTLEMYAMAVGLVKQSTRAIKRDGQITEDGRRHPQTQTLLDAMRQARQFAAELGLTPVSRNKIPQATADDADSLLDF